MPIPLEDNYTDVLGKSMRGLRIGHTELAERIGSETARVKALVDGDFDEALARQAAAQLGLGAEALVRLAAGAYAPDVPAPAGLVGFSTRHDDYHVNAYLVWDPATKQGVAFDTGSDCQPMLDYARENGITITLVLITHTHPDHILALAPLRAGTGAAAYVSSAEILTNADPLEPGRTFDVGGLHIEARSTWGHSKGGISYVVTGLETPVVVVGDALFAGSMGGGLVSFPDALANNRAQIFTLPDHTVIAPGHGPLTTVGLEKQNNPFYPEFARN